MIKTEIKETTQGHQIALTIGNQTFHLEEIMGLYDEPSLPRAKHMEEMLHKALEKLTKSKSMNLNEFSKQIHANNKAKGFYDSEKNIGEMLALLHSEVSEALECDRKAKYCNADSETWSLIHDSPTIEDEKALFEEMVKDSFEDELADIMIRVLDLAAFKGIDIEAHIEAKVRYNTLRAHKHGKLY